MRGCGCGRAWPPNACQQSRQKWRAGQMSAALPPPPKPPPSPPAKSSAPVRGRSGERQSDLGRPDNPNAESSAQAVLLRPVGAGSAASPGRAGRGSLFARRALAACMLVAGLSLGCALAHAETKLAAAGRQASRAVPARLRMRLRGGGEQADAATGLTEAQANALLEGAEEDESGPAAILTILRDYGGSANVVRLGCQRIAAAFTDAGRNVTECEALRTAYASAGGAMCVLETLKAHSSKGDPLVIAAVCAALRQLLAGPPNHAAEGDELWDQDCAATPIRVQCGRAGAAQMAIEVMTSYAAAAQHAAAEQDAAAVQALCGGYGVLEMLAMDYEGKQQQLELGAIPLLVQHLQLMPHHPRIVEGAAAALINAACGHDENKMLISRHAAALNTSIGKILGTTMDAHAEDAGVQKRACALMCNLAAEESMQLQKELVGDGAIRRILAAMTALGDDAGVQQECCAVLTNLARHNEEARNTIREAGGEALARGALKRHRTALLVEHYAQWLLGALLVHA